MIRKHRTPAERLAIVQEVDALPTTAARQARLAALGVAWATYYAWHQRHEARGPEGLDDGRMGRPRETRLDDLERRVVRLEAEIDALR